MIDYRIFCAETGFNTANTHRHVLTVGTSDNPDAANTRRTVAQVRQALADGTRFHTKSLSTAARAYVTPVTCYGVNTIRSNADEVTDNNLDYLRTCSWNQKSS